MTLRARLVAGLFVLMAVGLAIFGVTMYELYSRSQYSQLADDLRNSVPLVTQELAQKAGVVLPPSNSTAGPHDSYRPTSGYGLAGGFNPNGGVGQNGAYGAGATDNANSGHTNSGHTNSGHTNSGHTNSDTGSETVPGGAVNGGLPPAHGNGPGTSPFLVAPGTYGELLGKSGTPVASVQLESSTAVPRITSSLLVDGNSKQSVHLGSVSGSAGWLADIGPRLSNGDRVVVALPTSQVTASLNHLVLIESLGAASLLLLLAVGAGLVVSRGLAPLERMADTAKEIADGDLSQRVEVKQQSTEVGELAVAFNTMLDEIQQAFSERDATEARLRQFLADASHELRTPLTSIQGFAELFRLGADNPRVDKATIMRRIEEESHRMKGLVEDLLLLARLDQVRQVERAPVDLSVLAADACSDAMADGPGAANHPSHSRARRHPGRRSPLAPGSRQLGSECLEPHPLAHRYRGICSGGRGRRGHRRARPRSRPRRRRTWPRFQSFLAKGPRSLRGGGGPRVTHSGGCGSRTRRHCDRRQRTGGGRRLHRPAAPAAGPGAGGQCPRGNLRV